MFEGTPVGVKITLPVGLRTPQYEPPGRETLFENEDEIGLYRPTLEVCGQNITLPLGKRTPFAKFPEIRPGTDVVENV